MRKISIALCSLLLTVTMSLGIVGLAGCKPKPTPEVNQFPVTLSSDGTTFTYGEKNNEKTVTIGPKAIYVDGRLSDEQIEGLENVYNTFNDAMDNLTDGTEAEPMVMYVAPYVYWIHDPDSAETTDAFGIVKTCANLHIVGLTDDARNVVIAANYGHNEGYYGGNWTMFKITGDGLTLKNITFGDYCNVDLVYPLNTKLNRAKRTNNVTQGQIASYNGDKLYAENVRFISRLNMMPFNNSKRALYVNCHMESTDDSLNGSSQAVYLNCDFEFYSGKPWGGSSGVTLLNSKMKICHYNVSTSGEAQYLAKGAGPFTVVDCQFSDNYSIPTTIGWSDVLSDSFRSYYSNVTYNGNPTTFDNGGKHPDAGVDITGTELLKAYKLVDADGNVIYNVYNLLRGTDDWDPLGQKEAVTALNATNIATKISASANRTTIEKDSETAETATLSYKISGPQNSQYTGDVTWSVKDGDKKYVQLTPAQDGTCTVTSINTEEVIATVVVTAKDSSGLEAAVVLTVKPHIQAGPAFTAEPVITQNNDGTASVAYTLDLGTKQDMSRIVWFVCDDDEGNNPIEIAYGRSDSPLKKITLAKAYVGKYLKVAIESKHVVSNYGDKKEVVAATAITAAGITESNVYDVDLATFSTAAQTQIIDGFWTKDGYVPEDVKPNYIPLDGTEVSDKYSKNVKQVWEPSANSWAYGTGAKNGFLDYTGIYQTARGARIMYTADSTKNYGDMDVTVKLAPGKTAAQGFGSDCQYMDIMIKFDTRTLTGYGVRIYRTSGSSCAVVLMQYGVNSEGKSVSKEISESVVTSAYLTECTVHIWTANNKLNVRVESSSENAPVFAHNNGNAASVDLSADITMNNFGGFCLLSTGTVGDNATYIGGISIEWKN